MQLELGNLLRKGEIVVALLAVGLAISGDWLSAAEVMIFIPVAEGILWYMRNYSNPKPPPNLPF